MIIVNTNGEHITGSFNGKQFNVTWDEQKYGMMKELQSRANSVTTTDELHAIIEEFKILATEDYSQLVETACQYIVGNKHTNKFYLRYGDAVGKLAIPQAFVTKILKLVDKGIDVNPLIKCLVRFLRPLPGRKDRTAAELDLFTRYIDADYTDSTVTAKLMAEHGLSSEVAAQKATTKQVAITLEGLLVCYKVSTELFDQFTLDEKEEVVKRSRHGKTVDEYTGVVTYNAADYAEDRVFEPRVMGQRGDAFYCDAGDGKAKLGHVIKVGHSHYLDSWAKVGRPGDKGLHCGGLNYIKGYQQDGTVTHNIFVDPMHIHSIASVDGIGNDGAMTVLRYFVFSTFDSVNRNIYHSSTYAGMTDKEYEEAVKEVVKANEMELSEKQEMMKFNKSLKNASASDNGGIKPQDSAKVFGS